MIRFIVADNHPVVQYGIKSYFDNHDTIEIFATVGSFQCVTTLLQAQKIDVLMINLELEGLLGLKALKELIILNPHTKVLIFTELNELVYTQNLIKIGTVGFISKSLKMSELEMQLLKVIAGKKIFNPEIERKISVNHNSPKSERTFKKLSAREIEVLKFLNEGKRNIEIAQLLHLDEKTISTYKLRLLAKLEVTNLVDMIKKAEILGVFSEGLY